MNDAALNGPAASAVEPERTPALHEQATALRRVAEELDGALAATAGVLGEVAASWTDRVGLGWTQRLDLVGRELSGQAGVAADLARLVTGLVDGVTGADVPLGGPDGPRPGAAQPPTTTAGPAADGCGASEPGTSWSLPGPRLGGTEGSRAGERRGVVVPTLPEGPG